jgi:Domain of unknown function (DUF4262)
MDEEIAEIVRVQGWFVANVSDHQPPFMYTIGLMQSYEHPDFIMFGLDEKNTYGLFSALVRDVRIGISFAGLGVSEVKLNEVIHHLGFKRVHPTQHPLYLGYGMGFMRSVGRIGQLEAMQVFWPDSNHKFPFDVGCNSDVSHVQPRLDIPLSAREIRGFERQFE